MIRLPPSSGLLLAALLATAPLLPGNRAHAQAPAPNPAAQLPPVPVTVVPAARKDVPILLRNIGAVQAGQSAAIRPRVDGTLEQVLFTEGQEVKKGELIARLDSRPYQAVLDQALARKAAQNLPLTNFAICSAISHLGNMSSLDAAYAEAVIAGVVNTQPAARERLDAFAKGTAARVRPNG